MNTENPKEEAGRKKVPMHLLPPEALRLAALVHQHGADKYTAFNWRHAGINATTYIGAIMRHLTAWADGEDNDPETGLSHIAHIVAGCNIVMDAHSLGMMNDDRSKKPTPEEAAERMSRSVLREVTPGKPIPVALTTKEMPNTDYVTVEKEQVRGVGNKTWLEVNMPDGLPPLPAPPDGYNVWVYRGLAWKNRDKSSPILYLLDRTRQWEETPVASGVPQTHYAEALKQ